MIPGNIPLTFCTVLVRKFIDSYAGSVPAAAANAVLPVSFPTAVVLSGVLIGLYRQLRKGTLVKIGLGRKMSNFIRNSRHTIQRRVPLNSWFLRNAQACRRRCTEAMHHLARQSSECLEELQRESGTLPEVNSMPEIRITAMEREALARQIKEPPPMMMDLFNREPDTGTIDLTSEEEPRSRWRRSSRTVSKQNDVSHKDAASCAELTRDAKAATTHEGWPNSKTQVRRAVTYGPVSNRPITRHFFRKNSLNEDKCADLRSIRTMPKKRKKSLSLPRITKTTVEIPVVIRTEPNYPIREEKSFSPMNRTSRRSIFSQLRTATNYRNQSGDQASDHKLTRRKSEKIEPPRTIQKVTRKTRSGRIYAYRL